MDINPIASEESIQERVIPQTDPKVKASPSSKVKSGKISAPGEVALKSTDVISVVLDVDTAKTLLHLLLRGHRRFRKRKG